MNEIVVIIPVKDQLIYTEGIYEQLLHQRGVTHVIILDNGSGERTKEWAERESRTRPLFLTVIDADGKNIHEMWNMGIEKALEFYHRPHIAILNNDIKLGEDALLNMSNALNHDDTLLAVCPNYDGRQLEGLQYTTEVCAGTYDGTGGLAGFAFMCPSELFNTCLYRFPEELMWWCGDNDLVNSITSIQGRVAILGSATVEHLDGGENTGKWNYSDPVLVNDMNTFIQKWRS